MPTFEWKPFFSVGDDVMDAQHQRLFAIANELYDAMKQPGGAAAGVLEKTITALCDYTRSHFAEEEYLMLLAEYPDYEHHKLAHDTLIGKVEGFETRMRNGETKLVAEILPFLVGEWLANHIAFEDQRYAGYIDCQTSKLRRKYQAAAQYSWREPRAQLAEA